MKKLIEIEDITLTCTNIFHKLKTPCYNGSLVSICQGWGACVFVKSLINGLDISPFTYMIQIKLYVSTNPSFTRI